ncbi:metal-dependent transcriptional regulator [Protaetiibacter mangrovi]|uniref:Manganese transport regulator n=1 Tax=Protaetiibacter mangrovi TaxID=2970926 RepID=A0ABT1ZIP5_9MICO|nr:metal-dependent transcriptional regulator [Protaetiibacter mangrovi]MCS0500585.1 metal-dependent transcriptional regulator [Protaetiibacter mangrovi]
MIEDYLKAIYGHTEWQDAPITGTQLAARLGLVPSTVTEMVKKLVRQGLVTHAPYGAIALTDAGRAAALRMVRRHRLVETWLVEGFGYSWDEVHDEAEVLEHALSDRLLDAIDAQLGHPVRDPHGDPIPDAEGVVTRPDAVLASELPADARGAVARISDRDPEVLRRIRDEGIGLDTVVAVAELPADAREAVWIAPIR